MSDESRFDCRCQCPECVGARAVIRNLKKRLREIRKAIGYGASPVALDKLCDLRDPWPTSRTDYGQKP